MDAERTYLEQLLKGSYKDFTKLYELYASRLYAFALSLTHVEAMMAKNQLLNEFRQQELFELNKEQGLSIADIAAKTSITEQSIRNQISQALHILRKELDNYTFLFSLSYNIRGDTIYIKP